MKDAITTLVENYVNQKCKKIMEKGTLILLLPNYFISLNIKLKGGKKRKDNNTFFVLIYAVLSPFIIVMSEIQKRVTSRVGIDKTKIMLFANDIFVYGNDQNELQEQIDEWANIANEYGLKFSPEKSEILVLKESNPTNSEGNIVMNGKTLKKEDQFKYLGSVITELTRNIITRALTSLDLYPTLEPAGISRNDGKRPDGMSLIAWSKGLKLIWDLTCVDRYSC
uniref:Reverse transcriptase domain-containing protein n=3 Tax=Cacopsylla melanoneura TaxID=428564 RepID=A0A8D8SYK8_9HEMI